MGGFRYGGMDNARVIPLNMSQPKLGAKAY